jgi:hypothetical protein
MKAIHQIAAIAALSLLAAAGHVAFADEAEFDIDPRFRAKIAKEKAKQASVAASLGKDGKPAQDANCGSQSIGNVQTGGKPGSAPREVFVFAPNAINLVTARGCN